MARDGKATHRKEGNLFGDFADGCRNWRTGAGVRGGHAVPPRLERGTVAVQLDTHPVGELDPVSKMLARDGDHDGNVRIECAFDQVGEALAVALPLSEAVDDEEVGAGAKRLGDPRSRILKPRKIKPAAACAGSKSCGSNIFSPLWTSTADRLESAH